MEISELTGLPELPKDHFWRVSHRSEGLGRVYTELALERSIVPTGYYVSIMHTRKVHEIQYVPRCLGFLPYKRIETRGTRTDQVASKIIGSDKWDGKKSVSLDELTEEHILATAEECYRIWKNRVRAQLLLGDYPPKKLEQKEKN